MNFLRKQMKWVMAVIVVAFLLSTFLMYDSRTSRRTPTRNADGSMSDYEVAEINGRSLMRSELEQRLRNYLSSYSSRNAVSLDMPAIYQEVLDQAVLDSQLVKEVQERGIMVSEAEAEQAMKLYADTYYPTRETFYQALAQSGMKVEDYKRNLARQMSVERLLEDAIGEVEISEDKAVEFYDSMKNLIYARPEGFMVHMADFNTSADAENFRTRLLSGESWDVIASSDILSKDLINITKQPVFLPVTAFNSGSLAALASIDVSEPSPVFSVTSFDYAVGLKTSHVDPSVTPYDEVSADIKTLLTQQEQRNRLTEYEKSLRDKANVVIHDQSLFAKTETPESAPEFIIEEVSEDVEPVSSEKEETPVEVETETTSDDNENEEEELEVVEVEEVEETSEDVETEEAEEVIEIEETSEDVDVEEAEETESEDLTEAEKVEAEVEAETEQETEEPEETEAEEEEVVAVVEADNESDDAEETEVEVETEEPEAAEVEEEVEVVEVEETSEDVEAETVETEEEEIPVEVSEEAEPETETTEETEVEVEVEEAVEEVIEEAEKASEDIKPEIISEDLTEAEAK